MKVLRIELEGLDVLYKAASLCVCVWGGVTFLQARRDSPPQIQKRIAKEVQQN